jgi:hypothetical protein
MGSNATKILICEPQYKTGILEVLTRGYFWDVMPCSLLKVSRCFGGVYRICLHGNSAIASLFPTSFILISCLASFSTPKMEAACSASIAVDLHQAIKLYITEERTPHISRITFLSCRSIQMSAPKQ